MAKKNKKVDQKVLFVFAFGLLVLTFFFLWKSQLRKLQFRKTWKIYFRSGTRGKTNWKSTRRTRFSWDYRFRIKN